VDDKKTMVLSIILLAVLAIIIVAILTSGRKDEVEDKEITIGYMDYLDGEQIDPETLLAKGETLHVSSPGTGIPNVDFHSESLEPLEAPKKLANYHAEAVKQKRDEAIAAARGEYTTSDPQKLAAIDSIRAFREKKESEKNR